MSRAEIPTSWTTLQAIAPAAELPSGAQIGEYRIERKIGRGGMGTVYEAVHSVIEKRVALKVIRRELCGNAETIARFVQEARAVNRIGHPSIVDVFGFGSTPDGLTFLAMELLLGESLAARIARMDPPGPLPLGEACYILVEITHALEAAHGAGIIHRDLKPDNVFLVPSRGGAPHIKLLDFGIAKLTGLSQLEGDVATTTQPGLLVGTPRYIAPEQARGLSLDGRADIYALGVLAFELLTGGPPFVGDGGVELIAKHVTMRPPRAMERNPDLPVIADEIIDRMLAKDPAQRPSLVEIREVMARVPAAPRSADAYALAASRLEKTAEMSHVGELVRERAITSPTPSGEAIAVFEPDTAVSPRRRARWWLVPVAALAVIAVGIRIGVLFSDRSADDPPAAGAREAAAPSEPLPREGAEPKGEGAEPPVAAKGEPAEPVAVESRPVEPGPSDPRDGEARGRERPPTTPRREGRRQTRARVEARPVESRPAESRPAESRPVESRPVESRPAEPRRPPPPDDDALRDPFAKP